uniref:Endonuclease/exonuclease/phosphatase domain-containing protein n=1 Tax=Haptolina ericina TaxID=156174 RepID=A0A7S3F0H3_9EUKA
MAFDYIFTRGLAVTEAAICHHDGCAGWSDHLPIWARFDLAPELPPAHIPYATIGANLLLVLCPLALCLLLARHLLAAAWRLGCEWKLFRGLADHTEMVAAEAVALNDTDTVVSNETDTAALNETETAALTLAGSRE